MSSVGNTLDSRPSPSRLQTPSDIQPRKIEPTLSKDLESFTTPTRKLLTSKSTNHTTTLSEMLREAQEDHLSARSLEDASTRSKSLGDLTQESPGSQVQSSNSQYNSRLLPRDSPQKPIGSITQVGSMFFKTASTIVGTLFGDIDDISPIPVEESRRLDRPTRSVSHDFLPRNERVLEEQPTDGPDQEENSVEYKSTTPPVDIQRLKGPVDDAHGAAATPNSTASAGPHHETLGSFIFDLMGFKSRNSSQVLFENPQDLYVDEDDIIDLGHRYPEVDEESSTTMKHKRQASSFSEGPISLSTMEPVFSEASRPHVEFKGREGTKEQYVLELDIMGQLYSALPPLLKESTSLNLMYSLEQHGASLNTLYSLTAEGGPCIIAIKSTDGDVFGVFCSESIAIHHGYYGNGSCFLWRMNSETRVVDVYPATGDNDYWMLSEPHCIAFGGGDGKFGLWFDDELFHAHSDECITFRNEPLAPSREVELLAVEVWGFVI